VIDRELFAWDIKGEGCVTQRGLLAGEPAPHEERRRVA
jgi:hypothetical protein